MIRLFRDMRKKLATENKVMAYLRYAIGEIVLVVIGILIAVGINSQVTNYYDHQKETKFLKAINNDISEIKSIVENNQQNIIRVQLACDSLIEAIHSPEVKLHPETLNRLTDKIISLVGKKVNFQSYNNIKNTSDLNLIKSDAIKLSLSDIEIAINNMGRNIEWEDKQWTDINQIYINKKMDLLDISFYANNNLYSTNIKSVFKNNWDEILKDPEFSNIVINRKWAVIDIERTQETLKIALERSKKLIQEELDKRGQ